MRMHLRNLYLSWQALTAGFTATFTGRGASGVQLPASPQTSPGDPDHVPLVQKAKQKRKQRESDERIAAEKEVMEEQRAATERQRASRMEDQQRMAAIKETHATMNPADDWCRSTPQIAKLHSKV